MKTTFFQKFFIVKYFNQWKRDYRHFICIGITLVSIAFGFLFPNSLARLGETIRDLGTSIAFYFVEIIKPNGNPVRPTVLDFPEWQFTEDKWENLNALPYTWEEFVYLWDRFWSVFFTEDNFLGYSRIHERILNMFSLVEIQIQWINLRHIFN